MATSILGPNGEQSHLVRQFTEWTIRFVQPKDYLGEILAIRNVFVQPSPFPQAQGAPLIRYTNDPLHVELIKGAKRLVEEIQQFGTCLCDCDEAVVLGSSMLLTIGRKVCLVAMGFAPRSLSHVTLTAVEPKSQREVLLDGVAGPREAQAAGMAKEIRRLLID